MGVRSGCEAADVTTAAQRVEALYIHLERSAVCIAILLKSHTALCRLFGGAPGMRLYVYRYKGGSSFSGGIERTEDARFAAGGGVEVKRAALGELGGKPGKAAGF